MYARCPHLPLGFFSLIPQPFATLTSDVIPHSKPLSPKLQRTYLPYVMVIFPSSSFCKPLCSIQHYWSTPSKYLSWFGGCHTLLFLCSLLSNLCWIMACPLTVAVLVPLSFSLSSPLGISPVPMSLMIISMPMIPRSIYPAPVSLLATIQQLLPGRYFNLHVL